jgi:hypothetical protein
MKAITTDTSANNKHTVLWYGLGSLVLGTVAFFGIKNFTKNKTTNDDNPETNTDLDIENNNQNHTKPTIHIALPSGSTHPSFPIKVGDKGDVILKLQRALLKSFGTDILKKYGTDGKFGNELATFLRSKNYSVPLSQTDYNSLTQEKKEQVVNTTNPLTAFNPPTIAYSLYTAIVSNDFSSAITLIKGIANRANYSLIAEQFKMYRINGVRQTIVNALFNSFKTINQKIIIQNALKNMGLTYDGDKWSV